MANKKTFSWKRKVFAVGIIMAIALLLMQLYAIGDKTNTECSFEKSFLCSGFWENISQECKENNVSCPETSSVSAEKKSSVWSEKVSSLLAIFEKVDTDQKEIPLQENNIITATITMPPLQKTIDYYNDSFNFFTVPPKPPSVGQKKAKTVDDFIQETGIRMEREKVKEIKPLTYSADEIIYSSGLYRKGLIIYNPLINGKPPTEAVPLLEKDEFTYSATLESTTMDIKFDTPGIDDRFHKFTVDNKNSWKIGYKYLLPSETFTVRIRISSSSPIITDTSIAEIRSGKFMLDFAAEQKNNYDLEVLQVAPQIVYIYLTKNFALEGKNIGDEIIIDPTLTISGTTTQLCGDVTQYDKIEVINNGVLQICARSGSGNSTGYVNITLGYFGNFTLYSGSVIDGQGRGETGGAGSNSATGSTPSTQGNNGNNGTAGSALTTVNGGGGGGSTRTANTLCGGGAGGGFGGTGGTGSVSGGTGVAGSGGIAYGSTYGEILKMGSGGGGEEGDLTSPTGPGTAGGAGIKIVAGAGGYIRINGIVNVSGVNGTDGDATDDCGGGGGAGGHMILRAGTIDVSSATINVFGARGGNGAAGSTDDSCGGGGGGGGRVLFVWHNESGFFTNTSLIANVQGGMNGSTNDNCIANATVGSTGTSSFNSTFLDKLVVIQLLAPANLTTNTTDATPDFLFNVTDELILQPKLNCTLFAQNQTGSFNLGTNNSIFNATKTIITANASLNNGPYVWGINCSDGNGFNWQENYFDRSNISETRNITISYPIPQPDFTPPNVTNITPILNSVYNITYDLEIGVNVTDGGTISLVLANISYPNGSFIPFNLSNSANRPNWYNMTFLIPELTGKYNFTIVANDTSNNYNRTEFSNFTAKVGCYGSVSKNITLDQDVTNGSTCFTIKTSNTILNCSSYNVNFGSSVSGNGTNIVDANYVEVRNCNFHKIGTSGNENNGIYILSSSYSKIINNTISTNGSASNNGIKITNSLSDLILNNSIRTFGSAGTNIGIRFINVNHTSFINNTIITGGTSSNEGFDFGSPINYNNTLSSNVIQASGSTTSNQGIFLSSAINTTIFDNVITSNGTISSDGIRISTNTNYTLIRNNIISTNSPAVSSVIAFSTSTSASYNIFLNNNLTTNGSYNALILDTTINQTNSLIYNNSFGEIKWIDNDTTKFMNNGSFLTNLTVYSDSSLGIGLDRNLFIRNNTVGFNSSAFVNSRINSTVNITFFGINISNFTEVAMIHDYNLSINFSIVQSSGVKCLSCTNLSYSGNTAIFNATGLGVFSANDSTTPIILDITPPNVTNITPVLNSRFNASKFIEIGANITEGGTISLVFANISYPNGSIILYNLSNNANRPTWYNITFFIPRLLGFYNVSFIANDTSNNYNRTEFTNFTVVDEQLPNVTDRVPALNSVIEFGNSLQISANGTDIMTVSLGFVNITYPNSSVVPFLLSNSTLGAPFKFNISFTPPSLGLYYANFSFNDSSNNFNKTEFTNFTVTDTIPPNVTTKTPSLNSVYEAGTIATIEIGVNVTDRVIVDSVFANVSYVNGSIILYSLSNSTGNFQRFNMTFTMPIRLGYYNITFKANDSSNNINQTEFTNFTIRDTILPNVTLLYPSQNSLYNTSNIIYISANVTDIVDINKVFANISYPNGSSIPFELTNVSETPKRFNMTFVVPELTGYYNITIIANDTSNNYNRTEFTNFTVQDSESPRYFNLIEVPSDPTTYSSGTTYYFNATFLDNFGVGIIVINFSGTNYSVANNNGTDWQFTKTDLAAGTYNYVWQVNDSSNNRNETSSQSYTINQASPNLAFLLNDTAGEITFGYGGKVNASVFSSTNTVQLMRNGTDLISQNNAFIKLPAGSYNYSGIAIENQNYSSSQINRLVTVTQAPSEVNLTLNGTDAGITVELGSTINLTGRLITGESFIQLWRNGTLLNNGTSPVSNLTAFNALGHFNITVTYYDSQNYSSSQENHTIIVIETVAPNVTSLLPPLNSEFNTGQTIEIAANVTDTAGISNVSATIFRPGGIVSEQITLSLAVGNKYNKSYTIPNTAGVYNITFFANDTFNNLNNTERTNFTATAPPDITPPNITDLIPVINSAYFLETSIEIAANVTDGGDVSKVYANLTYPNGSVTPIELNRYAGTNKYNISYAIPNAVGTYVINFTANDTSNNYNRTEFTNFTALDNLLPSSISNLDNQSQTGTSIYWNWTNPSDADFSQAIIFINGSNVANTSNNYYNATGLSAGTNYTITIHTKDVNGNVNYTNISDIARTNAVSSGGGGESGGGGGSGSGGGESSKTTPPTNVTNIKIPLPPIEIPVAPAKAPLSEVPPLNASIQFIIENITGNNLRVRFFVTASPELSDLKVMYEIVGLNRKIVYEETETIAAELYKELVKSFTLRNAPAGEYTLKTKIINDRLPHERVAEQVFTLGKPSSDNNLITGASFAGEIAKTNRIALLLLIIVLIITYLAFRQLRKRYSLEKKIKLLPKKPSLRENTEPGFSDDENSAKKRTARMRLYKHFVLLIGWILFLTEMAAQQNPSITGADVMLLMKSVEQGLEFSRASSASHNLITSLWLSVLLCGAGIMIIAYHDYKIRQKARKQKDKKD